MSQPTPQQAQTPASPPPGSTAPAQVRASDAEREAVVEHLRVASVEGRLTFAELAGRTEAAYSAVTRADLEAVVADLPGMGAPGAAPAPLLKTRRFSAVLGDCTERIVGRIDEELEILAVLGDVKVDLRAAQVPTGAVSVVANAVLGDVTLIVPSGAVVELTGHAVLGDRRVSARDVPAGPHVPVVRVRANAYLGDIKIVDEEPASWW
ncbi:DUF1707 SHOCT-like domain-containing protein [Actinomadura rupiterrae]|uniref:DUF1707 SHOCT-like domain-containing protein n=1 Tax=Actinomadura rupiterrae TaxID=559627 RepID=UPI0020A4B198|nr:DUF1707 domain-containing protein [Actinomadura rupiterrae]MCP2336175.1 hypothetical protein [Actinomadura rupiterrae]